MNLLLESLPGFVVSQGKKYPVHSDFRAGIRFSILLRDSSRSPPEKLREAVLSSYVRKIPQKNPLEPLLSFYIPQNDGQAPASQKEAKEAADPVCDFERDASHLYAAFLEQYGLDLSTASLHWWKFLALLHDLSDTTHFGKIMGYRAAEIPSSMPEEQRKFYQEMKRVYALPGSRYFRDGREAEEDRRIDEILMGSGDLLS